MLKLKTYFLVLLIAPLMAMAQNEFPQDTSFAVYSTFQKIKKDFPQARPVKPFASEKVLSLPDQVYRVRENRLLRMDVFLPNNSDKTCRPVVMMIHGGGWRSGNKSHLVPLAQKLAIDGYVTATVGQRLSIEALYPAAVHDLKEAIRFLKHNSQLYGIDTTRIAVLGCSSGATMASLLATTGHLTTFDDPASLYPAHTARVQALINIDGVVDFTDPNESAKDTNPDKPSAGAMFFGATYNEKPELWKDASAINYVDKNTPPTLYINSALPRFHAGRDSLLSILNANNIYNEVHEIPDTPHPFWLFHPWFDETHGYIRDFLNTIFNKTKGL
ncbi:alpha/beta hydrolase [Gaoshiqia sediminis]|uniref:Alpha/beta hydrolase n=1 Tax=Gaoshiqia sediminis TaxID=2986998 RepID=A0AA41YB21_9BACT|nr:alpha/beta hydrolase [Gaoshiqia sediminis]MCW0484378.1 alpha/beta hydrolase [Gaoshiqia sediminis]